ncbi:MAG: sulfotransferase family protein [Altibacter sp.]|nr:sulfotransferase family protein [Altibacter sp.]
MKSVINLISGPRNLSTAIMYAFAQRSDCTVRDEPFYGYYLQHAQEVVSHPAEAQILRTMELEDTKIIHGIDQLAYKSHVFVKGMAHHYLQSDPSFILNWNNVILIRHPKKLIASFSKVIKEPGLKDIGIKKAAELFLYLKENNRTPIVIDSDELLKAPERYLRKLCTTLKLPFERAMLSWPKGGIPEDGIWASHWYENVHNSTGFTLQKSSTQPLPQRFEPLLAEAMPYYNTLRNYILKNDTHAPDLQP